MYIAQTIGCSYGATPPCNEAIYNITDLVGSYFGFDGDNGTIEAVEKTPISSFNGIHIGTTQAESGSHSGSINGSETPNIDNPWTFFGGTGMRQTTSPVTDLGSGVLDFSGWNAAWNGIASIPLIETAPTNITCDTVSCSDGSNYTIDGAFHVAGAGFTTVTYSLHLAGTVSSVPVPAWLFGSGLAAFVGVARRRKTA